jgi:two-component system alkaline phosphatase synthesis response regulator PhoP
MTKKVLLADDEERILGLVKATLGIDTRYEIILASDGQEALDACRKEMPDLVFLDLLMPKMDGYQVCREIKQSPETSAIKVVMLTAMAQEADRRTALKVGADDYMTKPFSPTALLSKVEEMLGL